MKFKVIISICFAFLNVMGCQAQQPKDRAHCQNPDFDKKVASWLSFSVPTIDPNGVKNMTSAILLDAREKVEYDVSHIPNARFIGYNKFEKDIIKDIPKDQPIIIYCSIGYRSEKIGEKLLKMGYTKVYNLYGSIFEWINEGNSVVDNSNQPTLKVHTFNKNWGKWVDKNKAEKVY